MAAILKRAMLAQLAGDDEDDEDADEDADSDDSSDEDEDEPMDEAAEEEMIRQMKIALLQKLAGAADALPVDDQSDSDNDGENVEQPSK